MLEIINYLQSFGVFLSLIEFGTVFESFEIGPEDTNSIEKMCSEIEVVLFTQSQLIVIVIQTLLGQSDHLSCFLQTHFPQVPSRQVQLTPLLHDLDDLKDHPLFTPLPLH